MKIEGDDDQLEKLNENKNQSLEKKQNIYSLKLIN